MSGRKKENFERGRVEFMAEPAWIERAVQHADRLGLSLSGFVRMVVSQYMDREDVERPPDPHRSRRSRP